MHISFMVSSDYSDPDVTLCVAGLALPEDGRPRFGVWSVVFTRMKEDASCAQNFRG